jgi:hypothetical protein
MDLWAILCPSILLYPYGIMEGWNAGMVVAKMGKTVQLPTKTNDTS